MDAPARLLRWSCEPHEFRWFEAFFAAEDDERAGQLPVVFLRFEDPFDDPTRYAAVLRGRLLEAIELARDELAGFVAPRPIGNPLRDLLATAEALCRHPGLELPTLALVLMPSRIADSAGWIAWLRAAVTQTPDPVRLVVFDWTSVAALRPLADAEPVLTHSEVADFDVGGAAVEISADAGGLDQPEGQFRHANVQMLDAIGKQDMTAAQQHAAAALDVATRHGWGHLEVAVVFGLASGFLNGNDPQRAIELYYRAEQRAVVGEQAGEPWAGPLRLNARLAMSAAAVMAQAWPQAASLYLDTVPVARALKDQRSELDCLRMASYCRANQGKAPDAWALGLAALELGEAMDAETRKTSTLAHLGVALERLAGQAGADWGPIERRLVAALGPNWRPTTTASSGFEAPGREVQPS